MEWASTPWWPADCGKRNPRRRRNYQLPNSPRRNIRRSLRYAGRRTLTTSMASITRVTDPRSGRRYRKVRADFIARCKQLRLGCWLYPLGHCVLDGAPIDYDGAIKNAASPELHHKRPCITHPHLVMEPSNFAIGHARCNQVLGKKNPLVRAQLPMHKPTPMHNQPPSMHKNSRACINGWHHADW